MTDRWVERLSEYLDGELAEEERLAMEQHLFACARCAAALEDLRRVVSRARGLGDAPPQSDLWPGIARRIESRRAEPQAVDLSARRRAARRRHSFSLPQLAAASLALVITSAAVVWLLQPPGETPQVAGVQTIDDSAAAPTGTSAPGQPDARLAATGGGGYAAAVADLERALQEGRDRLDPATLEILDQNLRIIDRALEDARVALERDPASVYLHDYVARTMHRKLELLRQANAIASART